MVKVKGDSGDTWQETAAEEREEEKEGTEETAEETEETEERRRTAAALATEAVTHFTERTLSSRADVKRSNALQASNSS